MCTAGMFNTVTEALPAVYMHASSSSDVDRLPRRIGYLLLAVGRIEVFSSLCPDQLESLVALFTFPRVELHVTDAVFHIETITLGEIFCGIQDRMVSSLRLGSPFCSCIEVGHVEPVTGRRIRIRLKILSRTNTD